MRCRRVYRCQSAQPLCSGICCQAGDKCAPLTVRVEWINSCNQGIILGQMWGGWSQCLSQQKKPWNCHSGACVCFTRRHTNIQGHLAACSGHRAAYHASRAHFCWGQPRRTSWGWGRPAMPQGCCCQAGTAKPLRADVHRQVRRRVSNHLVVRQSNLTAYTNVPAPMCACYQRPARRN